VPAQWHGCAINIEECGAVLDGTTAAIQLLLQLPAAANMPAPELSWRMARLLRQCIETAAEQLYSSSPVVTGCVMLLAQHVGFGGFHLFSNSSNLFG
jgi:hypothetical protein